MTDFVNNIKKVSLENTYASQLHVLKRSQAPEVLMVTCVDSRLEPCKLTQTSPGELLVLRNVGNIIPLPNGKDSSVGATIEFAVQKLKIRDIVIMGHSNCGAMKGRMEGVHKESHSHLGRWLGSSVDLDGSLDINDLSRYNVEVQLNALMQYECIKMYLNLGDLKLHGWFFNISNTSMQVWDAKAQTWKS